MKKTVKKEGVKSISRLPYIKDKNQVLFNKNKIRIRG